MKNLLLTCLLGSLFLTGCSSNSKEEQKVASDISMTSTQVERKETSKNTQFNMTVEQFVKNYNAQNDVADQERLSLSKVIKHDRVRVFKVEEDYFIAFTLNNQNIIESAKVGLVLSKKNEDRWGVQSLQLQVLTIQILKALDNNTIDKNQEKTILDADADLTTNPNLQKGATSKEITYKNFIVSAETSPPLSAFLFNIDTK